MTSTIDSKPNNKPISKPINRILLTGAGGGLGKVLRQHVSAWTNHLRLSDIADLGEARDGEEIVQCDLADGAAVMKLMEGVDIVLHFGGISVEDKFEPIMQANILGMYNLYHAVHACGVKRVVYASSSHVVGYYPTTELVDADMPLRPDGFYGISKCFGEALSRYYYDRFGIETVCLRIGSSFPAPLNPRMMVTYLSYADLLELIRCAVFTPKVGHTISFGSSDNASRWWDNRKASHLGYRPADSSKQFEHQFADNIAYPAVDDATARFQGGPFVIAGPQY